MVLDNSSRILYLHKCFQIQHRSQNQSRCQWLSLGSLDCIQELPRQFLEFYHPKQNQIHPQIFLYRLHRYLWLSIYSIHKVPQLYLMFFLQ
nr:MAG TPA: hypothetical protein [Caudoviricetes sp.]